MQDQRIKYVDDEVKVGFGRTGKMFAIEHSGVEPDVTVLGKSIGAGMPLSAVIGPEGMMDSARSAHVFTLGGHPVSCAASLASIGVIEKERLVENAAKMGESTLRRLKEMQEKQELGQGMRGALVSSWV